MSESAGILDPQQAVDQLFGVGRAQVIEAVTSTKVTETEVILVNGTPVKLVGEDGALLKEALLAGRLPDQGLLKRVLSTVLGDLKGVTKIESEVSLSSSVTTKDTLSVLQGGKVVNERTSEWQSNSEAIGRCCETFHRNHPPPSPMFASSGASNTCSSSSTSSLNSSPRPPSRNSKASSRMSPSPSPLNGFSSSGPGSFPGSHSSGSSSLNRPDGPGRCCLSSRDSGIARSSSSGSGCHLTPEEGVKKDLPKQGSLSNGFRLDLQPYRCPDTSFGKITRKNGLCLSPELEESLARTTLKDSICRSKKESTKGTVDDSFCCEDGEYVNIQAFKKKPTIFGTVADDHLPRDNTKRGLPQTPKSGKSSFNGVSAHTTPPDWALTADDDNSLVYEDGVLVSGSLHALVQHATPTSAYYPDTAYLFAFLLSARLFIKPHELLQRICNFGFSQQGLKGSDLSTVNKDEFGSFIPHMVQLLGEWSETFPYDFRDERVMAEVRTLTHRCIALQPSLRRDVTQVLHNLLNKLTQLERYEEGLAKLTVPAPCDFLPQVPDITEVCQSPLVMAQQLTHVELERLSYIGPEEFVQAFAKDNLEASYKDLKKTNNLESYVQWFNRLSYLVATQTCSPVKKKVRVKVIEWWIEVARECFNIGNFNSLMGIIAGLNMSPVSRLKKTWNKVQIAKFSVLEHQMDPSSNFSSYRSTLKAAMWRSAGAVDDRQKIVVPFFSLLVKDLYFLNEGCANRLPNGHINFDKFWQLAKQVTEFMAWKQVSCPFERSAEVLTFLQTTPVLTETGLALASFEGEGPENACEKERYKNLKADSLSSA